MAATAYTKQRSANWNSAAQGRVFQMVPTNSYTAAGEPVTSANVGLTGPIDMILFGPAVKTTGGYMLFPVFDPTTNVIRFFYPTGGAATAPSAPVAPVGLAGTGASTASAVDATRPTVGLTPGGGKEVPTGADLSDYIVYGLAFGAY